MADHEILRRIGVGAYGEVWLARSITGALRAVKVVSREHFEHERTYEREFAGLKKFEPISRAHEGLVDILHVGRNADCFYCVMELADDAGGGADYGPLTVAEMTRCGKLSLAECARIGASVAGALAFLHKEGLVHRDVKPSNIIFVNGHPKLADIGLVASVAEARSFVGTDGFIPPEGPGAPRGDIYALGKTLYEMATGKNRLDFPDLPADLPPGFLELNEIILRACAAKAEERHASAEELRSELLLLEAGQSIREIRRNERLVEIWRRIGLAACVIFLIGAAALYVERRRAQGEAEQRRVVEAKERAARENLYAADMNLAQQAIESGNYGRAEALLSAYLPGQGAGEELRGLEWFHYWHTIRGDSIATLRGHSHVVSTLALSPDGARLFSGSFDMTVREWSLDSLKLIKRWDLPGCLFSAIALNADGTQLAGEGGNRRFSGLLDLASGAWKTNITSESPTILFTPDGQHLMRAVDTLLFDTNGVIQITDVQYNAQKEIPESGGRAVFSADGKTLATGPWGEKIKIWSWPELQLLVELDGAGVALGMAFSPDGSKLASVSRGGELCLWGIREKRLVSRKKAHGGGVIWSVAFSPDGVHLVTAGNDQTVRTWKVEGLEESHVYRGHGNEVWSAIWTRDGGRLISSGKDMTIRIWDATPAPPMQAMAGVMQRPVFSEDGKWFAARLRDGSAVIKEESGEFFRIGEVSEIGGFAQGNIVVLRRSGQLETWSVIQRRLVGSRQVKEPAGSFTKRLLSPSGRWLVTGYRNGEIVVLDCVDGKERRWKGHADSVVALGISHDDQKLLSGGIDRTARLWSLENGGLLQTFGNHRMAVGAVAFSRDGSTLATGSWDDSIHVWNSKTGRELMVLDGHEGGVQAVEFSPDNRTIAGLSGTSVLKFWSLPAKREAGQIQLARGTGQGWIAISSRGDSLAAVSQAGEMKILKAPR